MRKAHTRRSMCFVNKTIFRLNTATVCARMVLSTCFAISQLYAARLERALFSTHMQWHRTHTERHTHVHRHTYKLTANRACVADAVALIATHTNARIKDPYLKIAFDECAFRMTVNVLLFVAAFLSSANCCIAFVHLAHVEFGCSSIRVRIFFGVLWLRGVFGYMMCAERCSVNTSEAAQ